MKTLFFLLVLAFSSEAFCRHNYFQETCTFDSKKGEIGLYKRHYWDGHHMMITSDIPGLDNYPEVFLPGAEGEGEDSVNGNEAIVFSDVKDTNEVREPYDDGCWQGYTISMERTVQIKSMSDEAKQILELSPGDELTMKCGYEHLVVLGDACD